MNQQFVSKNVNRFRRVNAALHKAWPGARINWAVEEEEITISMHVPDEHIPQAHEIATEADRLLVEYGGEPGGWQFDKAVMT